MRRILTALVLLAAVASVPGSAAGALPTDPPLRILAIGDSITVGNSTSGSGRWQDELDRLMTKAQVPHVIETEAVSGSRCGYWTDKIDSILTSHNPDLVILNCGTNDDRAQTCWGEPCTDWAWRVIVEAVHNRRPANPIRTLPTLIGYSDPLVNYGDDVLTREPVTNDGIYAQFGRYPTSWYAGFANVQVMPATATYLDDGGVHPTARGYRTIGRIYYDALQGGMGWPTAATLGEPVLCDMYGHRKGYARPSFTPCQG